MTFAVITIPFKPVSWKAPKLSRNTFYNPRAELKTKITHFIRTFYRGPVLTGQVSLEFAFFFSPSEKLKKKWGSYYEINQREIPSLMDCTNMQKFYEDCLQGIVIENDRQVVYVKSSKLYGRDAKVMIRVYDHRIYEEEGEKGFPERKYTKQDVQEWKDSA